MRAIQKSTLDQPGTKPFHLQAEYAPSLDRDKQSHREGTVEFWWKSPTEWRREVRSPDFHQVEIVSGGKVWQHNEGDFFPVWLHEIATALVRPVPFSTDILQQRLRSAEIKALAMQVNYNWNAQPGSGESNGRGYLALYPKNEMLFYTGGLGWGGLYKDFHDFHGRQIAYAVSAGVPEVTAKVNVLEDLAGQSADWFNAGAPGGDAKPIDIAVVDETELRRSLHEVAAEQWPPVQDGPLEGVVWTEAVLDREGKVRDMLKPVSDNPALVGSADAYFRSMSFQPVLRNGVPVEAIGRIETRFKTTRPAGMESFRSAREYFDRGRAASLLSGSAKAPYVLRAEFKLGDGKGGTRVGRYEDTWFSATEWRREAWIDKSHFVRSQSGRTWYRASNGPDEKLLGLVVNVLEPLPASDTMTESDWRIKRDTVDGQSLVRVFRGPEGANGDLDPEHSQGYWFDANGVLVRSYTQGLDVRPVAASPYLGTAVPRQIQVRKSGTIAMLINVTDIVAPPPDTAKEIAVKGHEWQRAFTAETR